MTIYVDADSCPRRARELIIRAALRTGTQAVFAANRPVPGIPAGTLFRMEICPQGSDKADDFIAGHAAPSDIAVTRDVPLAARLVQNNVTVMDDRGRLYTQENIRYYLSLRNFAVELAENNLIGERAPRYGERELKAFAASLDKELCRLQKILLTPDSTRPLA
ncbi:MAG: DUF188 domain-containing protein [Spirochaetaceae bacterium]|nr:DUF188 domain-containing protein [Spirochaetaceae bacterium]